ncbi:phenylalanyl-tRNA synthetase beta chain [Culex quinquefasciatus]|uniref:Phenylalanyl-tRNA synthetase beta chain n=1 Tax=Culex quinquefasciatus TaxID=7176 RepID=B0XKC7_CULQU|nr:phenylalanyl-tRNA synthetase beta chain [Culex quinquefasciatus]|eukprot:XP_001870099.1 phenylalanyl-tRNA synthetase beta chain [Culex quinquefasciatus]
MAAGGVQLLQQWIKQCWTSDAAGESAGSRCGPFISAGCWNDGGSRRPGRLKESTDAKLCFELVDAAKDASENVIYRIDIPANRYDLLCLEGLARV